MARTVSIPVSAETEGAVTLSWASAHAQRVGPAWPVRMVSCLAWVVDILQARRMGCRGVAVVSSLLPKVEESWAGVSWAEPSLAQKVRPSFLPLPLQSAFLDTMGLVVGSTAVALMGAYVTVLLATAAAQLAGLGTSVRAVSGVWEAGRFCQG